MKVRVISAVVAAVILFAVLLCPYTVVLALAVAAAAAIAVWELLHATGMVTERWILGGSMLFSVLEVLAVFAAQCVSSGVITVSVPLSSAWQMPMVWMIPVALLVLYAVFMLLATLRVYGKKEAASLGYAVWMTLYATAGFAALAALRYLHPSAGIVYILFVMVIPWMSDMGAYFIGTFCGKHKMAPVISPKKSWEGFFGGWLVSVGASALYALICNTFLPTDVSVLSFAIVALVLAPLSVCGDLFASVIKRQSGIKDYGKIMPGHGGVMDRFDSVVCIAPLLYILLLVL